VGNAFLDLRQLFVGLTTGLAGSLKKTNVELTTPPLDDWERVEPDELRGPDVWDAMLPPIPLPTVDVESPPGGR
jgi:hypothetical protein